MSSKTEFKTYILLAAYVIIFSLGFLNSSPFMQFTDIDSAVFINMGRSMLNGKVMYKDLFDHKGLYIYVINYIAALINDKNTTGLFIVETLFMTVNAFVILATCKIFCSQNLKASLLATMFIVLLSMNHFIFQGGNFTECYTLPFQFMGIYLLAKYLRSGITQHKPSIMFVHGILVAIVLNLRPNHVLMWVPVAILIAFRLAYHKNYGAILSNFLAGILGLAVGIIPVVIYIVVNDAVCDAIFGMFTYNFMYIDSRNMSLAQKISSFVFNPYQVPLILMIILSCVNYPRL